MVFCGVEVCRQIGNIVHLYSPYAGSAHWVRRQLVELQSQWVGGCARNNVPALARWWQLMMESAYRLYRLEGCEDEVYEGAQYDLSTAEARERLKIAPMRASCEEGIEAPLARSNLILEQQHLAALFEQRARLRPGDGVPPQLEVYCRSNLVAWRQQDLHDFPLQRRMACALTFEDQAALP